MVSEVVGQNPAPCSTREKECYPDAKESDKWNGTIDTSRQWTLAFSISCAPKHDYQEELLRSPVIHYEMAGTFYYEVESQGLYQIGLSRLAEPQ